MSSKPVAPDASQIGVALKAAREAAGLSQAEVARRLSVESVTVSRWERGLRRPPRPSTLLMAEMFGVAPQSLGEEPASLDKKVSRGTSAQPVANEDQRAEYAAEPRHLRNLPLEVRVYLDELRLRLTKGGATEEEVDRAMILLRRPSIFSWYSSGTPKDLSPAKILQTMKAITESAILPYLREQGRKV